MDRGRWLAGTYPLLHHLQDVDMEGAHPVEREARVRFTRKLPRLALLLKSSSFRDFEDA